MSGKTTLGSNTYGSAIADWFGKKTISLSTLETVRKLSATGMTVRKNKQQIFMLGLMNLLANHMWEEKVATAQINKIKLFVNITVYSQNTVLEIIQTWMNVFKEAHNILVFSWMVTSKNLIHLNSFCSEW